LLSAASLGLQLRGQLPASCAAPAAGAQPALEEAVERCTSALGLLEALEAQQRERPGAKEGEDCVEVCPQEAGDGHRLVILLVTLLPNTVGWIAWCCLARRPRRSAEDGAARTLGKRGPAPATRGGGVVR